MRVCLTFWLTAAVAVFTPAAAFAQVCDAILKNGIWEYTSVANSTQMTRSFLNHFCSHKTGENSSDKDFLASIGIPIEGIPVEIGGEYHEQNWKSYTDQMCSKTGGKFTYESELSSFSQKASEKLAAAWTNCINTVYANNVISYVEYAADPNQFSVHVMYRSTGASNKFWITTIGTSPRVSCDPPLKGNVQVTVATSYACTRDNPAQQVTIVINTRPAKIPPGQLTVPGFKPIAAEPTPSITARIRQQQLFHVTLDRCPFNDAAKYRGSAAADELGNLLCGETYDVWYLLNGNLFRTSGYSERYKERRQHDYGGADLSTRQISLWGRVFTFDDKSGVVSDSKYGPVGKIWFSN